MSAPALVPSRKFLFANLLRLDGPELFSFKFNFFRVGDKVIEFLQGKEKQEGKGSGRV